MGIVVGVCMCCCVVVVWIYVLCCFFGQDRYLFSGNGVSSRDGRRKSYLVYEKKGNGTPSARKRGRWLPSAIIGKWLGRLHGFGNPSGKPGVDGSHMTKNTPDSRNAGPCEPISILGGWLSDMGTFDYLSEG